MAWKIAGVLAGAYAAVVGLGRLGYRSLLYPAPQRGLRQAPPGSELRELTDAEGTAVQVLFFAPPSKRARVIVYFHGNGETIADGVDLAQALALRGLGFMLVEYRGYGSSPARGPSEQGLYQDAEAALHSLHGEGISPDRITLWGSSLGSGVAVEMALRGHGERLILSAPYTSIPQVASRWLPVLPMRLIVGDVYDNLAKAPRIKAPTLVIHGDQDGIVPYDMGVLLAKTIEGARLITVTGAGHNDTFIHGGGRLLAQIEGHATACSTETSK